MEMWQCAASAKQTDGFRTSTWNGDENGCEKRVWFQFRHIHVLWRLHSEGRLDGTESFVPSNGQKSSDTKFGKTCSPSSAQFKKAISSKHYVDNYLDGADSEDEANKLIAEVLRKVPDAGEFELRSRGTDVSTYCTNSFDLKCWTETQDRSRFGNVIHDPKRTHTICIARLSKKLYIKVDLRSPTLKNIDLDTELYQPREC